jgi:dTDP-4-amino-4,6-dideoxygalactose transaminase
LRYVPAQLGGHHRDEFLKALRAEGIPCSGGYVPLIHQPAIRNTLRDRFGAESLENLAAVPHADYAGDHIVWMTQTVLLGSEQDISDIVTAFTKITRAWSS